LPSGSAPTSTVAMNHIFLFLRRCPDYALSTIKQLFRK
jgi:hypothetical protein